MDDSHISFPQFLLESLLQIAPVVFFAFAVFALTYWLSNR